MLGHQADDRLIGIEFRLFPEHEDRRAGNDDERDDRDDDRALGRQNVGGAARAL